MVLGGSVVVSYGLLFLRYPLELEYLLPTVPFLLLALGLLARLRALVVLCALTLLYGAVSLNVARPDRPLHATSVEIGAWVEPGYLVADVRHRLRVRSCRTIRCWHVQSQDGAFAHRAATSGTLRSDGPPERPMRRRRPIFGLNTTPCSHPILPAASSATAR